MLTALLLAAPAFADVAAIAAPCQPSEPAYSQPAAGAADVPVDAVPAVFFSVGQCGTGEWTLSLATAADEAVVASITGTPTDGLLELDAGELVADTDYVLSVIPVDGSTSPSTIAFTTGVGATEPGANTPQVTALDASWSDAGGPVRFDVTALYGESAGADLNVRWSFGSQGEARETRYLSVVPGIEVNALGISVATFVAPPAQYCLTAAVREFDGSWTEGDDFCAGVEDSSAVVCSTAGGGASLAGVLVALGVAAGRRSKR